MSRGRMNGQQWRDQQEYSHFPPTETKIDRDREFDQTAKTEPSKCFYCDWPSYHGHKIYCPNNSNYSKTPDEFFAAHPNLDSEFTRAKRSETPGPRTVSPSILEFKIQTLEKEKRTLTGENIELVERLRVANNRIYQFEQMAAGLAAKIDEFERGFKAATGKAAADFLSDQAADTKAVLDAAANAADVTRCWRAVWSRGEIAACMLDHDHAGDCSADRPAAETPIDRRQKRR